MDRLLLSLAVCAGLLCIAPAHAADAAVGKALAEEACMDCHGEDGKGDDTTPAIAGKSVEELTKAMKEYQDGTRTKDAKMAKAAKKLSEAETADLVQYYSTLQ
jgi:cytochrome subunit of sulfide dehydrogenase